MHEMIQRIFQKLQELINNTNKYVSIGQEKNVLELNDALADGALNLVKNITADDFIQNESEKERNLMKFRLFLGLVQHEPSTLCLCMNRKTEHIIQCNKLLHSAAEKALSNFMDLIIDETVSESNISKMPNYVANPTKFLDLAQELEKHKLPDSESIIEIPTQLSRFYYNLLYSICQKSNSYSVGHLFTRNVTTRIATILGEILSKSMIETAKSCCSSTPVCTQVQFDAKILFFMFLNKDFMEAVQIVEEKMDPITRTILAEPLTKNAKLFVQRTTLLFGQLQVEPPTSSSSKEIELAPSYTSLIDIVPMITNIPRLPLIPGLSVIEHKTIEEKPKDALKKKKQDGSKVFDQSSLTGLLAKPSSISSFVDKFSSNWFKN
uniref:Uncharacterized protein n=1 Tax=Panagrolaimus sp. JU765 TaxID=591449 RepID=A0AC34QBC3_9BILA